MTDQDRPRLLKQSDWHNYRDSLKEGITGADLYRLRQACYAEIEKLRERPLFVYATQFLEAPHPSAPISLDLRDIDGFIDLVESVNEDDKAVDVLIHSPGGAPDATERVVSILRNRFSEVAFLVPHSAYSAATMLALSGNEVILHPCASLGPIDPQINGVPARAIRKGFERVRDLLKEEGPEALPAYIPLIEKHSLEILEICQDAEHLAQELVRDWLKRYMFKEDESKIDIIEEAVSFFSSYDSHKIHSRPLFYEKIKDLELKITVAESPLRELMREAYIWVSGWFSISPMVKLFENSKGLSWGQNFVIQPVGPPKTKE